MAATAPQDQNASQVMPIVFTLPDMAVDTRLQVFDQAFHVHSTILTLYSAFFRKFLNSADKSPATGRLFLYEYKTRVDGDGMWGLEASSKIADEYTATLLTVTEIDKRGDTDAFHKLLCAMYQRTYQVENIEQLTRMTRLADYYCALPILSSSLNTILWDTRGFVKDIPAQASALLPLAYKLKQPILFQECMLHVVGSEAKGNSKLFNNPALDNLVAIHFSKLCEKITTACLKIFSVGTRLNEPQRKIVWDNVYAKSSYLALQDRGPPFSPAFFHQLHDASYNHLAVTAVMREYTAPLLVNNLRLDLSNGQLVKTRFLCIEVATEDLPWDCTEIDW